RMGLAALRCSTGAETGNRVAAPAALGMGPGRARAAFGTPPLALFKTDAGAPGNRPSRGFLNSRVCFSMRVRSSGLPVGLPAVPTGQGGIVESGLGAEMFHRTCSLVGVEKFCGLKALVPAKSRFRPAPGISLISTAVGP